MAATAGSLLRRQLASPCWRRCFMAETQLLNTRHRSVNRSVARLRTASPTMHPAPPRGHPQPTTAWPTRPPHCQGRSARRQAKAAACTRHGSSVRFAPYRIRARLKPTTSISSGSQWPSILRACSLRTISMRPGTETMSERGAVATPPIVLEEARASQGDLSAGRVESDAEREPGSRIARSRFKQPLPPLPAEPGR